MGGKRRRRLYFWPRRQYSARCLGGRAADNLRFHHAKSSETKLRTYASFTYQANSWDRPRKVVARLECSLQPHGGGEGTATGMRQEVDIRYVVTSLDGTARYLYEDVYCQRGEMESLIKLHKAQLASDYLSFDHRMSGAHTAWAGISGWVCGQRAKRVGLFTHAGLPVRRCNIMVVNRGCTVPFTRTRGATLPYHVLDARRTSHAMSGDGPSQTRRDEITLFVEPQRRA
jgi:hypothetical protein